MLMMMRSIVMMKMRMMISYTMYSLNSNALLFTTNILNGQYNVIYTANITVTAISESTVVLSM